MNKKLIVIGLDGGTFDVFEPVMEQGLMPNLKSLIDGGVKGRLETVIPPITGPAWVSFATGLNPGKHGTVSFFRPFSEDRDKPLELLNSENIEGLTFWEILADAGRKVVVLNIPQTFPPQPYNGITITKIASTGPNRMASYPAEWKEKINAGAGVPSDWCLLDGISQTAPFLEHMIQSIENDIKINKFVIKEADWDCLVSASLVTDTFFHHFWRFIDPKHALYDEKASSEMQPLIERFYKTVDAYVGLLLEQADEDSSVFLVSDHGFGPLDRVIYINKWLVEKGWLVEKKEDQSVTQRAAGALGISSQGVVDFLIKVDVLNLRSKVRHSLRAPIRKAIDKTFKRKIDWEKTKAYFRVTAEFGIYLIPPFDGQTREQFRDGMMDELKKLTDPETGTPLFAAVLCREDVYHGPYTHNAPDIILLPFGDLLCNTEMPAGPVVQAQKKGLINGFHRSHGIFAIKGPGVKKGAVTGNARIIDVAPTVLYQAGLPVDENMDGVVLTDCYEKEALDARPVEKKKYDYDHSSRKMKEVYTEDDTIEIETKLKGLGYLD